MTKDTNIFVKRIRKKYVSRWYSVSYVGELEREVDVLGSENELCALTHSATD